MFRKKDSQRHLFESRNLVPAAKQRRLQASWAETFRAHALPLIDEEQFACLYCNDNGRPNQPVATVLGVLVLKEMFALTDAEALEQLEFSLLWQARPGAEPGRGPPGAKDAAQLPRSPAGP